jgi:hypothetical protein
MFPGGERRTPGPRLRSKKKGPSEGSAGAVSLVHGSAPTQGREGGASH